MIYWTFLVIVFGAGPFEDSVSIIPFPNARECGDAMPVLEEFLRANHPDVSLHCMQSELASGSIRPKPRPKTDG